MPTTEYIPVRYLRNADERATGAVRFNDDDRDDIEIGGTGVVTQEEFNILTTSGLVFDVLDGDEAKEARDNAKTPEPERTLEDLQVDELRTIADDEGVDLQGKTRKQDIIDAINEGRQETGPESLPATATRTPGVGITGPGAGGAAGPGGAAAAPGASGGGPAT